MVTPNKPKLTAEPSNKIRRNPRIPEGINTSREHPLKEFLVLVVGVLGALILLVVLLSVFAKYASPYFPLEWEPNISFEEPLSDTNLPAQESLQDILNKLTPNSIAPDIQYKIHLINSEVANAFATLGGNIFINSGLLSHIESENGLAMVIAHEMAHVQLRHPIQALSRTALYQLVTTLVLGDSSIATFAGQAGNLTLLSFNRDMERDADQAAINILIATYGHGKGADEFFKSMLEEDRGLEFFNTHPDVDKRIEFLSSDSHNDSSNSTQKTTQLSAALLKLKLELSVPIPAETTSIIN
jgi:predicted Zn-dependent protease